MNELATAGLTCRQRVDEAMAGREAQIEAIDKKARESESYFDEEAIYELALSVEIKKKLVICLSWGGPADYLEVNYSDKGGIDFMEYRFTDWYDSAALEVEEGSWLWQYGVLMYEGMAGEL